MGCLISQFYLDDFRNARCEFDDIFKPFYVKDNVIMAPTCIKTLSDFRNMDEILCKF